MIDCQIFFGYFADHNIIIVLVASEYKPFKITTPPANKNAHHNFLSLYNETFFFSKLVVTVLWTICPLSLRFCYVLYFRQYDRGSLRVQALNFTAGSQLHDGITSSRGRLCMQEAICSVQKVCNSPGRHNSIIQ